MRAKISNEELEVFQQIVSGLSRLKKEAQARILQSVATFLEIVPVRVKGGNLGASEVAKIYEKDLHRDLHQREALFSDREEMLPKNFILEKEPRTEPERVACLAYYLTHYRDTPHFKTLDVSTLNTEAAQQKFSNPTQAVKNAERRGLLAPVARGKKQLSAMGERFVEALPNVETAKEFLRHKSRRRKRKTSSKKQTPSLIK